MIQKQYIDANQLNHDSFTLAKKIYDDGLRPNAIIVLWRGGSLVGMAIQEFFELKGIHCYHTIVKTSSYQGIDNRSLVEVENMDHVLNNILPEDQVLLVDDIFDTGATMNAVKNIINSVTQKIKIATVFYKPARSLVDFAPDYYLHQTDRWLVLPHELIGLSPADLQAKDKFIADLINS